MSERIKAIIREKSADRLPEGSEDIIDLIATRVAAQAEKKETEFDPNETWETATAEMHAIRLMLSIALGDNADHIDWAHSLDQINNLSTSAIQRLLESNAFKAHSPQTVDNKIAICRNLVNRSDVHPKSARQAYLYLIKHLRKKGQIQPALEMARRLLALQSSEKTAEKFLALTRGKIAELESLLSE